MRWRSLFVLVLLAAVAGNPRADAIASVDAASGCVSASVEAQPIGGQILYRIVFLNQCDGPRTFFWCAEHPGGRVPPPVACPRAAGAKSVAAEPRHVIAHRKEFQWNLPAGSRIRYRDCASQQVPTIEFGCAPPASR